MSFCPGARLSTCPPPFPAHYLQDERNQSKISRRFLEFSVIQLPLTSTEYLLCVVLGGKYAILYHSGRDSHDFYNLLWEIVLEQRLTQTLLFLLLCQPSSKGRKHFPKMIYPKNPEPYRGFSWDRSLGFTEKHSKFLLCFLSVVTSLNLDSDKETSSRKNNFKRKKKGFEQ